MSKLPGEFEVFNYEWFSVIREPIAKGRKLPVFRVENLRSGDVLGYVKWYGRWRQFCFFPSTFTVWSRDCLSAIGDFLRSAKLNCHVVEENLGE